MIQANVRCLLGHWGTVRVGVGARVKVKVRVSVIVGVRLGLS